MIGIPVGLAYANAAEWFIHRYVLHGAGKRRSSFWSFHFYEHHRESRKHGGVDPNYRRSLLGWHGQSKEAVAVLGLVGIHIPLFPIAPFFTSTVVYAGLNYYRVHKRAHLDAEWAREHLPWHYDHHMGPDQEANWCVTKPWFDDLMGTRKPYAFTPSEEGRLPRNQEAAGRAMKPVSV